MSAAPVFFITPRIAGAVNSTSVNSIKLPGTANNLTTIVTGAAGGSVLQRVILESTATGAPTSNNVVRFFLVNGASSYMVHEQLVTAVTPSTTVAGARYAIPELVGLKLPDNTWTLAFGVSVRAGVNDDFVATAEVADL